MQHISAILPQTLVSITRQQTICDFIEELRAAKGWGPLSGDELEKAGFSWDKALWPIPEWALAERDETSLFVSAARNGYVDAGAVWGLWYGGRGAEMAAVSEAASRRQETAELAAQPEPVGPGRQRLQAWLTRHGVDERRLAAMGGVGI